MAEPSSLSRALGHYLTQDGRFGERAEADAFGDELIDEAATEALRRFREDDDLDEAVRAAIASNLELLAPPKGGLVVDRDVVHWFGAPQAIACGRDGRSTVAISDVTCAECLRGEMNRWYVRAIEVEALLERLKVPAPDPSREDLVHALDVALNILDEVAAGAAPNRRATARAAASMRRLIQKTEAAGG